MARKWLQLRVVVGGKHAVLFGRDVRGHGLQDLAAFGGALEEEHLGGEVRVHGGEHIARAVERKGLENGYG